MKHLMGVVLADSTMSVGPHLLLKKNLWRDLVKLRANFTCEHCGTQPEEYNVLEAHHLNQDNEDHRLANGQCLCDSCHSYETKLLMGDAHSERMNKMKEARKKKTKEENSEILRRAWETRRAKYPDTNGFKPKDG